jgi:hypothetical protein
MGVLRAVASDTGMASAQIWFSAELKLDAGLRRVSRRGRCQSRRPGLCNRPMSGGQNGPSLRMDACAAQFRHAVAAARSGTVGHADYGDSIGAEGSYEHRRMARSPTTSIPFCWRMTSDSSVSKTNP